MRGIRALGVAFIPLISIAFSAAAAETLDLSKATVVVRDADTAAEVLAEEVKLRTGQDWPVASEWPGESPAVVVMSGDGDLAGRAAPDGLRTSEAEGYGIAVDTSDADRPVVWVVGADPRGALFGVGRLLRNLECREGSVGIAADFEIVTSPAYPLRGHQLGYRARANSWDAWTVEQFDQHIRELAFFGTNAIENIPFQDASESPHFKVSRREMNRAMSAICDRYGLEYWVWTPADFDLTDEALRTEALARHEELYADCPRLDAVFFPGGDPGDNPTERVMPFLEEVAARLNRHHPEAKIWISLQGFDDDQVDAFYAWVNEHDPAWMGGVVAGPSSPPIPDTRNRLPRKYKLRHYPDITHIVRCQYPVPWLDPAIAFTLGREPINPRPVYSRIIHNNTAPYTDGFLSYSDGVHDDLNKAVWSALAWDPNADLRQIVIEYARVFFGPDVAETAADGIFALERNWEGSLAENGAVDGTLALWQGLETQAPELADNWRWQMCLVRAYYDAYVRHRLLNESALEKEACARLAEASTVGADRAMDAAGEILKKVETEPVRPEWRERIVELCDDLFESIALQTSVERYQASGAERGAILDYVDYPLNNRWWIEDEIAKAHELPSEEEKVAALLRVARWEDPGPGGFYDDIGNVAKSDHVIRGEQVNTLAEPDRMPIPDFMWWEAGMHRYRQSWVSKMDWPLGLRYFGLDPEADYVVRTTGYGDCHLRANGVRVAPTADGREIGDVKEFPLPRRLTRDGILTLTFDVPFEPGINWRQQSRLSEVWLIRK